MKKVIIGLLVITLMLPLVFTQVGSSAAAVPQRKELTELRTEASKTFIMPDGKTLETEIYGIPDPSKERSDLKEAGTTDSYVSSKYPNNNYRTSGTLFVGAHFTQGTTRSFLQFDTSHLPVGAQITMAKLDLYHSQNVTPEVTVDVRPVEEAWSASTITWNNQPPVGSSASNLAVAGKGKYSFYLTALVTSWVKGTKPNHGVSLRLRDEKQASRLFYSSDYTGDESFVPKLTVQYTLAKEEMRGIWVDMFRDGAKTPTQVDQLLQDVKTANANAIFLQIRRRGDAYYNHSIEPRTEDPALQAGYDPLADLIQKAHASNIQVHAWFSIMPIWSGQTRPKDTNHVFNRHGLGKTGRDFWLSEDDSGNTLSDSGYVVDPGHPDAVDYTVEVITHVVQNYDVDGVHLDLIRYMGPNWGYNPTSMERFNQMFQRQGQPAPSDPDWKQWRREQVSNFTRKVYLHVLAIKPQVVVSAATITWGDGPKTMADYQNSAAMNSAYQDWNMWLEKGWIDLATPMNYFREHDANQQRFYRNWLAWEKDRQYRRKTVVGLAIYLNSISNSLSQIRKAQEPSAAGNRLAGVSLYNYAQTNKDGEASSNLYSALARPSSYSPEPPVFAESVRPPDLPWKSNPTAGHLGGRVTLDGDGVDGETVQISGPVTQRVKTDGNGEFAVIDLPPGQYRVTAGTATKTVNITKGKVVWSNLEK